TARIVSQVSMVWPAEAMMRSPILRTWAALKPGWRKARVTPCVPRFPSFWMPMAPRGSARKRRGAPPRRGRGRSGAGGGGAARGEGVGGLAEGLLDLLERDGLGGEDRLGGVDPDLGIGLVEPLDEFGQVGAGDGTDGRLRGQLGRIRDLGPHRGPDQPQH